MRSKLTWVLTLFVAFALQFSYAQDKTITGTITDQDGLPLPGANVLVKGTTNGTQTDFDGNYSIVTAEGATLVFSYIGQQTEERVVGASSVINVQLVADAQALEEVVVVGYGTTTRESYTGTATTIEAEKIELKNFSNVSQSLAGEAAGVNVINTSGQPGTTSTIRIRGFGSINGNRSPLYVVDGVPFSGSLNAINPADIKSTTILKDATATAIYGSRGANGVVLITTKGGTAREDYIEVDVKTGVNTQMIPRYEVITSPEEFIGLVWEAKVNRETLNGNPDPIGFVNDNLFATGSTGIIAPGYNMWNVANGAELIDPATGMVRDGVTRKYTPERFEDLAFDSAVRTEAGLRMGGGNEQSKYFVSIGYLDDNGYALNTGYQRYSTRLNLNSQVKEWLNFGANIGYTYSETLRNGQTNGAENLFEFADKMPPIYPVFLRDDNGELVPDPIFGGNQYDYGSESGFRDRAASNNLNPIASAIYDFNGDNRHEVVTSFNAKMDILPGLTFESTFGAQYFYNEAKSIGNQFYGVSVGNEGDLFETNTTRFTINFLQMLRYKKDFGQHSFEALVGHESNDIENSTKTAFKSKAVIPGGKELNNYINNLQQPTGFRTARTLESYLSQINYDFADKYYLSASFRRDGSSRFANNKWDSFWSVGGSWVMSNEDFLSGDDLLSFLKLKASYGVTGDEAGVAFYSGLNTLNVSLLGNEFSVVPDVFADPTLTWETAKQWQVGVDFSLGRFLDGTVDYYNKNTQNLFFERRIPPSTGVAVIDVNDGELLNKGLEFDFTGHIIRTEDITLDLTINGALLDNEIKVMPIDNDTGEPGLFQNVGRYGYAEGRSIFDFYMREYAGVDPADGYPMWNLYFDDVNGNGVYDNGTDTPIESLSPFLAENPDANIASETTKTYADATQKYIGKSAIPDVQGAFRLNSRIYGFNVAAQFTYSLGGYGYDSQYAEIIHDNNSGITGQNRHVDVRNRWREPGDVTDVPRIADRVIPNVNSQSTRFITSTDYLALNNILVGYTFADSMTEKFGMSGLNVFFSGDNLFFKGARKGFNPQTSEIGSSGRGLYAPLTTFTFGLRAKF